MTLLEQQQSVPLVSVVIPTRNRRPLLARALRSAFQQTYSNIEVIVVIDGPDSDTRDFLDTVSDTRLHVIALEENVRGGEARNIGVRAASGSWIAFLDDDDEWLSTKLEKQLDAVLKAGQGVNFAGCKWDARMPNDREICPDRFPSADEDWSEYVYVDGQTVPSSAYLVKRELMMDTPFIKGLSFNQDIDWILRAWKKNTLHPVWLEEAFVIYHADDNRPRTSKIPDWKFPLQWAEANRSTFLSGRAFAYCILVGILPRARKAPNAFPVIFMLFRKALASGNADLKYCIRFAMRALLGLGPKDLIRILRRPFLREQLAPASSVTTPSEGAQ